MNDAAGIRRHAGIHASLINRVVKSLPVLLPNSNLDVKLASTEFNFPYPTGSGRGLSTLNATIAQQMLIKVPEITIFFWIIKIMATTIGETAADLLNENLNFGLTNTTFVMGAF